MTALLLAVAAVMAAVLLWAGLEKARNASAFAGVLRELGLSERTAYVVAPAFSALEVGVAFGLIFRPHSVPVLAALVGLAAAFALAGLLALRQRRSIHCGCFGPHGGLLGWRQVLALPLWLGGAVLLWVSPATPVGATGPARFAFVALTIALVRAVSTLRAAIEARADRRSTLETFVWLPR
jgi:hypothetical protein